MDDFKPLWEINKFESKTAAMKAIMDNLYKDQESIVRRGLYDEITVMFGNYAVVLHGKAGSKAPAKKN